MKKNIMESTPLLTESDIEEMRKLGLTDEEYDTLQNAETIVNTVDMLPPAKDLAKFATLVSKVFPGKNVGEEITNFFTLAQTNPDLFVQIATFYKVLQIDTFKAPVAVAQKVTLEDISVEKDNQEKEELKKSFMELVEEINKLSPEEKAQLRDSFGKK